MSELPAERAGALVSCDGLSVRRAGREVVREVSMELRADETVALLGPNGAGKSTLLDALVGALVPASGSVVRRGRVAAALQAPDLARRSVLANVMLALSWWGVSRSEREQRARDALHTMSAEHLADRPAVSLSGGERRRVHIARSLAVRPDVLLLDEPFAGLDAETRATLLEDSVSALRSAARAVLFVVHDRAEAWALADRLLIMIDGRLVAAGPPAELLDHPPDPVVARFLGYDGELQTGDEVLLTRPSHVKLNPQGPVRARVTRAVGVEDGFRLELEVDRGKLYTVAPLSGPKVGELVRVSVEGGARFPASRASPVGDAVTPPRNAATAELG